MRRSLIHGVLLGLVLLVAGCGDTRQDTQPVKKDSNVFVGQIEGTDALIALVIENNTFTAYTCGQEESWQELTGWFEGTIADNSIATTPGGWDMTLEAVLSDGVWQGKLTASGISYNFTAEAARTDRPAGFYLLNTDTREAGLIIDNSLTTAGVYYGKVSKQTSPVTVTSELAVGSGQLSSVRVSTTAYGGSSYTLQRTRTPFRPTPITPERSLRQAVSRALPGLRSFQLINLDDGALIKQLLELARTPRETPIFLSIPVIDTRNSIRNLSWTVYHNNVRDPAAESCTVDLSREGIDCQPVEGPSLTYRGLPDLPYKDFLELMTRARVNPAEASKELADETRYQFSLVGLVSNQLVGTYAGAALEAPSVIQGLTSVLSPRYGQKATADLLASVDLNYLLYNRLFYNEPLEMPAPPVTTSVSGLHHHAHHEHHTPRDRVDGVSALKPQSHFDEFDDWPVVRPMMVADSTIWDAVTQTRLVDDYFERVDYAANAQDTAFNWFQIWSDAPTNISNLAYSNTLVVRTQIGGYWRLTPTGQAQISFPSDSCGGSGSFIQILQNLSPNTKQLDNEYWAWWTNHDFGPLGCAFVGTFGNSGRDGAISWQNISQQTLDATASTFMHETGHLMNGTHNATAPHPTTTDSQQCRLIGLLPLGPTGPSLNRPRIAGTTRTSCFAPTLGSDTTKKNLTRIAEHMHNALK